MSDPARGVAYWFDFASSYSYLSTMRIEAAAARAGVALVWRPFLLGPIFQALGWETSPFRLQKAKGAYMARDIARRAAALGIPFQLPESFPSQSVAAARWAIAALETPAGPAFCRAVAGAHFGAGRALSEPELLADCAAAAGLDPETLARRAEDPALKPRLRENTEAAMRLGIFGAPSFIARGELFWGDEQLANALAWARAGRLAAPGDGA